MRADEQAYSAYYRTRPNQGNIFATGSSWRKAKPLPLAELLARTQVRHGKKISHKAANPVWVGGYLERTRNAEVKRSNVKGRDVVVLDLDGRKASAQDDSRPAITDEDLDAILAGLPFPAVTSPSYSDQPGYHCYHIFVPLSTPARPDQYPGVAEALVRTWRENVDLDTAELLGAVIDTGASQGIVQQTYLSGLADGSLAEFRWSHPEMPPVDINALAFDLAAPRSLEATPPLEALTSIGSLTRMAPTLEEVVRLIDDNNLPGAGLLKMTGKHSACWHTESRGSTYGDPGDDSQYPRGTIFFRSSDSRVYQAFSDGGPIAKAAGYLLFDVGLRGYDCHPTRIPMSDPKFLKLVDETARSVFASHPELLKKYTEDRERSKKTRRDTALRERQEEARKIFAARKHEIAEAKSRTQAPRDIKGLLTREDYTPARYAEGTLVEKLNEDLVSIAGISEDKARQAGQVKQAQVPTLAAYSNTLQYVGLDTRTNTLTYAAERPAQHPSVLTEMREGLVSELAIPGGYLDISTNLMDAAIWKAANERAFNPRLKYLFSLAKKAQDNLEAGTAPMLGRACPWQAEPDEYAAAVTRSIALGVAWSQILPGGKKDLFPIICGPQGLGKTSILQSLGLLNMTGSDVRGWQLKTELAETAQDAGSVALVFESMADNAIAIWDEFDGRFNRRITSASFKAFVSLQGAVGTPKYIREAQYYPVSFMPVGTTNSQLFIPAEAGFRRYPVIEAGGWANLDDSYRDTDLWVKNGAPAAQQLIGEAVLKLLAVCNELGGARLEAALCREAYPHPLTLDAKRALQEASTAIHERMFDEVTKPYYADPELSRMHREVLMRHMQHAQAGTLLRHYAAVQEPNVDGMVDVSVHEALVSLKAIDKAGATEEVLEGWAQVLGGQPMLDQGIVRVPASCGKIDPLRTDDGYAA